MAIRVARVYDPPSAEDGVRVLVDRLWPRGLSKQDAHLDAWPKEVAPSNDLRRWFGHDPARFEGFVQRYRDELADNPAVDELRALVAEHDTVTLLHAAADTEHNNARVLADYLRRG